MTGTPEDLAGTPDFEADAFSQMLEIVHVRGETARVINADNRVSMEVPQGTPSVYILDHGQMQIEIGSAKPVQLHEKQIALMLHGAPHRIAFENPRRNTPTARLISPETGERIQSPIQCFCGRFSVDNDLAAKILQSLPQVIVLDDLDANPIEWIDMLCKLVLVEVGAARPGGSVMVSRLLDLLLVQILRRWAQSDDALPGWLAATRDERVARAVAAIHGDSARSFTNAELADLAGMSVSSFAERFKHVMGQQPGAYVRNWRLEQAAEALLHSSAAIDAIAERVGYASKEAFSRAFQTKFGVAPSAWRAARK